VRVTALPSYVSRLSGHWDPQHRGWLFLFIRCYKFGIWEMLATFRRYMYLLARDKPQYKDLELRSWSCKRQSAQFSWSTLTTGPHETPVSVASLPSSPAFLSNSEFCTQGINTLCIFSPEDGGGMYPRNVIDVTHVQTVCKPKNRIKSYV
jgi:hypothetical protein